MEQELLLEQNKHFSENKPNMKFRWTMFNYTDEDIENIKRLDVKYLLFAYEKAPSTGKDHLQGFFFLKNKMRFKAIQNMLFNKAFVFPCQGSIESNREYCLKTRQCDKAAGILPNEVYYEQGDIPSRGSGNKDKWDKAKQAAIEGRMDDIPAKMYIQNVKSFEFIHQQYEVKKPDLDGEQLNNLWLFGPPGTGKSRLCRMFHSSYYVKPLSKWWNNYKDEEVVIIEEVGKEHGKWLGEFLKIWADRYNFIAESKGSSRNIRPKHILVNSNYSIHEIFATQTDDMLSRAITRRFMEVYMPSHSRADPKYPIAELTSMRDGLFKDLNMDFTHAGETREELLKRRKLEEEVDSLIA